MKNKIGFLRRKNPIFQESQDASISASFFIQTRHERSFGELRDASLILPFGSFTCRIL